MNGQEFEDYFSNMIKGLYTDDTIILILKYGYEIYREGRTNFVKERYPPNKRPEKTISKYVRARMLLDNLLMECYPIEKVDELLSPIDWAIQQKYSTFGKVKKEYTRIAKEFLQKEYPFSDKDIVKIFGIYNEIIVHDDVALNTLSIQDEEMEFIDEYQDSVNMKKRIDLYIKDLKNS